MYYLPAPETSLLAISTEDGRVLFYDTSSLEIEATQLPTNGKFVSPAVLPSCSLIAQLGGLSAGVSNRIKDFEILKPAMADVSEELNTNLLIVTASSDGAVRIWLLDATQLNTPSRDDLDSTATNGDVTTEMIPGSAQVNGTTAKTKRVGSLVGIYETGNRITCLKAFIMSGQQAAQDEEEVVAGAEGGQSPESDDDSE